MRQRMMTQGRHGTAATRIRQHVIALGPGAAVDTHRCSCEASRRSAAMTPASNAQGNSTHDDVAPAASTLSTIFLGAAGMVATAALLVSAPQPAHAEISAAAVDSKPYVSVADLICKLYYTNHPEEKIAKSAVIAPPSSTGSIMELICGQDLVPAPPLAATVTTPSTIAQAPVVPPPTEVVINAPAPAAITSAPAPAAVEATPAPAAAEPAPAPAAVEPASAPAPAAVEPAPAPAVAEPAPAPAVAETAPAPAAVEAGAAPTAAETAPAPPAAAAAPAPAAPSPPRPAAPAPAPELPDWYDDYPINSGATAAPAPPPAPPPPAPDAQGSSRTLTELIEAAQAAKRGAVRQVAQLPGMQPTRNMNAAAVAAVASLSPDVSESTANTGTAHTGSAASAVAGLPDTAANILSPAPLPFLAYISHSAPQGVAPDSAHQPAAASSSGDLSGLALSLPVAGGAAVRLPVMTLAARAFPWWAQLAALIAANVIGVQALRAVLRRLGDRAEPLTLVRLQLGLVNPPGARRGSQLKQLRTRLGQLNSMIQVGQHGLWLIVEEALLELSKHQQTAALADVTVVHLESKLETYDLFSEVVRSEATKARNEEALAHPAGQGSCVTEWDGPAEPQRTQLWHWLAAQPGMTESGCDDALVVTLVVAARGHLDVPSSVGSWADVCSTMKCLCGLSSERLMAVDITWAPSQDETFVTRDMLLKDYANLKPLKMQ